MNATQLRVGMIIKYEDQLCKVLEVHHLTPGNKRGHMQTKLRNIQTGVQFTNRFRADGVVERAVLEQQEMEYLYSDASGHVFMNTETYDQLTFDDEMLGETLKYLTPNSRLLVDFHEGNPVSIEPPLTVNLRVTETEPNLRGATASGGLKPATLETGLVVGVPRFIEVGQIITINTAENKYVERARS